MLPLHDVWELESSDTSNLYASEEEFKEEKADVVVKEADVHDGDAVTGAAWVAAVRRSSRLAGGTAASLWETTSAAQRIVDMERDGYAAPNTLTVTATRIHLQLSHNSALPHSSTSAHSTLALCCDAPSLRHHSTPSQLYDTGAQDRGWGVQAVRELRKGEVVCEYAGEWLDAAEAASREARYPKSGACYMFFLKWRGAQWCVDATVVDRKKEEAAVCWEAERGTRGRAERPVHKLRWGFGRYINHSRRPNVLARMVEAPTVDQQGRTSIRARIAIVTSRFIADEEVLLLDYNERRRDVLEALPWLISA